MIFILGDGWTGLRMIKSSLGSFNRSNTIHANGNSFNNHNHVLQTSEKIGTIKEDVKSVQIYFSWSRAKTDFASDLHKGWAFEWSLWSWKWRNDSSLSFFVSLFFFGELSSLIWLHLFHCRIKYSRLLSQDINDGAW